MTVIALRLETLRQFRDEIYVDTIPTVIRAAGTTHCRFTAMLDRNISGALRLGDEDYVAIPTIRTIQPCA